MMRWLAWLLIFAAGISSAAEPRQALVVDVLDGDSLLTSTGEQIDLLGVDASDQLAVSGTMSGTLTPVSGTMSRQCLASLCQGRTILLVRETISPHGETLAIIQVGQVNVNLTSLKSGWGWVSPDCPEDLQHRFHELQSVAAKAKAGIWSSGITLGHQPPIAGQFDVIWQQSTQCIGST